MAEVVIYTRQLCGFCTAAKRLLEKKGVAYTEHDASFDPELRREMIQKSSGRSTFPQIFVGGEHIGGATETFDAFNAGKLQELLVKNGVAMAGKEKRNAYSFMPGWLHPR